MAKTRDLTEATLERAIKTAMAGDTDPLYALLGAHLWLDDCEVNVPLVERFASAAAAFGAKADELIEKMTAQDELDAEENTEEEILPICGLAAYGDRVAKDLSRLEAFVEALNRTALDKRARVRAMAPLSLARAGEAHGAKLLERFSEYLETSDVDSFVLDALALERWLGRFPSPEPIVEKLDQCLRECAKSPPGWAQLETSKRLMASLERVPATIARRFPDAVGELLGRWDAIVETGPKALAEGKPITRAFSLERIPPILKANRGALGASQSPAAKASTKAVSVAAPKHGRVRRFELVEGSSAKFWEIALDKSSFTVRFGRLGTEGQSQDKTFPSEEKAKAEHDKLVGEKVKKGYAEVGAVKS